MKPWWNHVQWVSVTNVLKHLRTRQYRSSQQTWWNIYHINDIKYHSCNLCGWRHSTKYITKHNLVDFYELDKNMEHIHHGMTLMELDVKVHKSPEPTIWLWNYLEVITYKKGVDVLSLDRFGWSHVTLLPRYQYQSISKVKVDTDSRITLTIQHDPGEGNGPKLYTQ